MALPPEVELAKARMDKADAALRADIESDAPVDRARRLELIDELQISVRAQTPREQTQSCVAVPSQFSMLQERPWPTAFP